MPNPDELPPHVRRLVDEIESEIGESDVAADEISGDTSRPEHVHGARRDGQDGRSGENGGVGAAVRQILEEIGEDPERQGLLGTPERVHRMYIELTAGYHVDPE